MFSFGGKHTWLHVAVLVAGLAHMYSRYSHHKRQQSLTDEQAIVDSWAKIILMPPSSFERVVVGINSNVDLILSGISLLNNLNVTSQTAADHAMLETANQISESFAKHFVDGHPAERFLNDPKTFAAALKEAERLPHKQQIGGNAALIANSLLDSAPHLDVTLVGPIGPRAKTLLHSRIITQNSARIAKDEIHIVMQYKMGQIYGEYVAAGSSRFIVSHDLFSSSSVVIDMFFNTVATQKPDLVVFTGLHLLEHQQTEIGSEKLRMIKRSISQFPRHLPCHLQMGSLSNAIFTQTLLDKIVPHVDSIFVREQELALFCLVAGGPCAPPDKAAKRTGTIHVHKAVDMINWLLSEHGHEHATDDGRRLTRVHFQALTYQIVAVRGRDWSNSAAATAAG